MCAENQIKPPETNQDCQNSQTHDGQQTEDETSASLKKEEADPQEKTAQGKQSTTQNSPTEYRRWFPNANRIIAIGTVILGVVGICGLVFTCQQLKLAERQLIMSERPWLGLDGMALTNPLKIGQPIKITVTYQNTGKSPAHKVTQVIQFITGGPIFPDQSKMAFPSTDWCDTVQINPGEAAVFPNQRSPSQVTSQTPLSDTLLKQLSDRTIGSYITGCLVYEDQFHVIHRTKFFGYMNPEPSQNPNALSDFNHFAFCRTGQHAD